MSRIMKGSLIVFSLLIIFLIISQGAIFAKATITEVTGELDLSGPILIDIGEEWVDEENNHHVKNRIFEGIGTLIIGPDAIDIRIRYSANSVADLEGNINYHGKFVEFIGEVGDEPNDENTIFEGTWSGKEVASILSDNFRSQGRGEYAGTIFNGTVQEEGVSNIYLLEGSLLDPHGE